MSPDGLLDVPRGANVVALPEPTLTRLQKHRVVSAPLFTREPCVEDVRQGQLGDCYVLAGINAILRQPEGPLLIQTIMRDNKDGTVTIRMYKDDAYQFVRTRKTIVKEYEDKTLGIRHGTGKVLHNQGAVWVSILEKAYLTFIRSDRGKNGAAPNYKDLEMGGGTDAMQAFIGPGLARLNAKGGPMEGVDAGLDNYLAALEVFGELLGLSCSDSSLKNIPAIRNAKIKSIGQAVFGVGGNEIAYATNWYNWNNNDKKEPFGRFRSGTPSSQKFEQLMDQIGGDLDPATRLLVVFWVQAKDLWPGDMGSGIYTPNQLNLFLKVQRALATNRAVTVGTKKVLQGVASGKGHSSGESMVAGIAAEHEYSVIDTKVDGVGRRYIKVRNPWGQYGRTYTTQSRTTGQKGAAQLTPQAAPDQAESWIELTDLEINFGAVGFGGAVNSPARQAFTKNLANDLQAQRAKMGLNPV